MPNIEFETEQVSFAQRQSAAHNAKPGMVRMLLNKGLVKNESQANFILIGVVVLIFLISIFILVKTFGNSTPMTTIPPDFIIQMNRPH